MMITPEKMADVMRVLEGSNLNIARQGQSRVWYEALTFAVPAAEDSDLGEAVMRLITQRPGDRAGRLVGTRELVDEVRKVRSRAFELEQAKRPKIEPDSDTGAPMDTAQLLADIRRGMDPGEAVRRARKSPEGEA